MSFYLALAAALTIESKAWYHPYIQLPNLNYKSHTILEMMPEVRPKFTCVARSLNFVFYVARD